jgi:3-hydroxybutyrate dehydrogenase
VAAKHGVIGITTVAALETATSGVTSNAICPGWVLTPLVQKQIDDQNPGPRRPPPAPGAEVLGEKLVLLEFGAPQQMGAGVVFLCSDGAAQIRGVALPVGGWTANTLW